MHVFTLPLIWYSDKDGIAGRGRGGSGDDGERDWTRDGTAGRGGDDVEGAGNWLATTARIVARRWKRMVPPLRNLVFEVS